MPPLYTTGQSQLRVGPGDFPTGSNASANFGGVVRPSSTTPQGFDPSYIQNLATSTGGTFMRPGNGILSFNPLGNLTDIPSPALGGGNAPLFGQPQSLLQPAQNAAIARNADTGPTVPTITPPTPVTSGTPNTVVPGSSNNLFFGSSGKPQPVPGSPLYNAIMQAYQQTGFNFTNPPNLAPIYEQFGLMFSPGGGIIINTPSTGGTTTP